MLRLLGDIELTNPCKSAIRLSFVISSAEVGEFIAGVPNSFQQGTT